MKNQVSSTPVVGTPLTPATKLFAPLPATLPWCVVIPNFLSRQECLSFIAQSELRGYRQADTDYPPSYRNNARQVFDSFSLAQTMTARLRAHAPLRWEYETQQWAFSGVNERFRFCRYDAGQQFHLHQDGVYHRPNSRARSFLTFMIYLSDGDEFSGGDTLFFGQGPSAQKYEPKVLARLRPRAGSLILFDHALWHAGERVAAGVKHIMRSDVIYEPIAKTNAKTNFSRPPAAACSPSHQGYVWALSEVRINEEIIIASGGRDRSIRLWNTDGEAIGELHGHSQSVLGIAALPACQNVDRSAALNPPLIASVSRDRTLKIWNLRERKCALTVKAHEGAVLALCAFAIGKETRIATGSADGQIKIWRNDAEREIALVVTLVGHTGWVWKLLHIAQANCLVSASEDGNIKIWDCATFACTQMLVGQTPLRTLASDQDGTRLWAGGIDGKIVLWRLQDGLWTAGEPNSLHAAAVRGIKVLNANQIATAGEDNFLRIWNVSAAGALALHRQFAHDNFVTDILPTDDGCISCAYDGGIKRWHL